jgi:hypothetical protein
MEAKEAHRPNHHPLALHGPPANTVLTPIQREMLSGIREKMKAQRTVCRALA